MWLRGRDRNSSRERKVKILSFCLAYFLRSFPYFCTCGWESMYATKDTQLNWFWTLYHAIIWNILYLIECYLIGFPIKYNPLINIKSITLYLNSIRSPPPIGIQNNSASTQIWIEFGLATVPARPTRRVVEHALWPSWVPRLSSVCNMGWPRNSLNQQLGWLRETVGQPF